MKCSKCGSEFYAGAFCPNCGNPVSGANETVAYNEEISVPIDDKVSAGPDMNVYSHGTPQPSEGIFANQTSYNQGPNSMNNPYMGSQMQSGTMYNMQGTGQQMSGGMNMQPQSQGMYGYNRSANYANPYPVSEPPKKNSKLPFIIAAVALAMAVIAIIVILVVVVFPKDKDEHETTTENVTTENNNGEPDTDDPAQPHTKEPDTTGDTTEEASTTQTGTDDGKVSKPETPAAKAKSGDVLYSKNDVEFIFDTITFNSYGELIMTGTFNNNSSKDVGVGIDYCTINGASVYGSFYSSAKSNATDTWNFTVSESELALTDIDTVTDIEIYFSVYDSSTYLDIFVDSMAVKCDVKVNTEHITDASNWKNVYSDDNCEVEALDFIVFDSEYEYYYSYFKVKNKLDKSVGIMVDDAIINGKRSDMHGGLVTAAPGSTAYVKIYWYKEDITEEKESFKDVEVEFLVYDTYGYTTYSEMDIAYNTTGVK